MRKRREGGELRPLHMSPKADHWATTSSFLYFERDPCSPDIYHRAGTEEHASRRVKSHGAAQSDFEANGAVQVAPDQF
jgi:hypothetical protein